MNFDQLAVLFDQVSRRKSRAEIDAFLEAACPAEPELRKEVASLLEAREKASDFLETAVRCRPREQLEEGAGDQIGDYRLLNKLGEGGCGAVYLAEQRRPVQRYVALKIIKPGLDTKSVVARFEAERQALALMEHPNVARVFDAGVSELGRPYFVMEWVRGLRITTYCDSAKLSLRARLGLFIKVCQAIQHAHHKGVIHRDIKPANILIADSDGIPEPKVIDFGIAKAVQGKLTDQTVVTVHQQFLGTPAYMSPEQAAMRSADIDTRSDVYSLGVLLYELLTGQTPFDTKELMGLGLDEMLRTIRTQDPVRPSARMGQRRRALVPSLNAARARSSPIPADLDWIVMKCLEKDPSRRYQTANELALDAGRHLANEPVLARPPSAAYRFHKTFRRHRAAFVSALVVIAALVAGTFISLRQAAAAWREAARAARAELAGAKEARSAREERDRAEAARTEAVRRSRESRRYSYAANLNVAFQAYSDGNLARVRAMLEAQAPSAGEEDLRDFEWRYLWKESRGQAISHLRLRRVPLAAAAFSPDGKKLFTAQLYDPVRVFELPSLKQAACLSSNVLDISLSRDGKTLAVLRDDHRAEVYDVPTLEALTNIENLPPTADRIVISPDGSTLALSQASEIAFLRASDGKILDSIRIRERKIGLSAFAASPDWSAFLTSDSSSLLLWDRATGALTSEIPGHEGIAFSGVFSPNGRWLATGGWLDNSVRLWDLANNRLAALFGAHTGWIGRMDFSPDGRTLASCSADHTIRLWDLEGFKEKGIFRGPSDEVWVVRYSPDGHYLVSGDRGGGVSLWNASPPAPEPVELRGDFIDGTFSSDSRSFVTYNRQGELQAWDAQTLREFNRVLVPPEGMVLGRISPDAAVLALGFGNGSIQLHDLLNQKPMPALAHPSGLPVTEIVFSPDGGSLASATRLGLRVWNLAAGALIFDRENAADFFWKLTPAAVSPGARSLAYAAADLRLRLTGLSDGAEQVVHPDLWGITGLAFSSDGRLLAGGGRDHRIKIWRSSDLHEIATLKAWKQGAHAFAFHPSSLRLAVAPGEGGIRLIDLSLASEVGFLASRETSHSVAFSPDGNTLVGRFDQGYRFWRASSWEEILASGEYAR